VYELISNVVISIGILCIVLALVLAFVFKVGTLINEVSGRRARKQIKELKEMGVASGFLKQSSGLMDFEGFETVGDLSASMISEVNVEDRVLESDEGYKSVVGGEAIPEVVETAKKISTSGFEELITSEEGYNEDATQLLDDLESEATTMLESAEEEVGAVSDENESTEFLEESEEGTNLLVEAEEETTGMLIDEDNGVVLEVLEVLTSVN
jgi:hypothetical protein